MAGSRGAGPSGGDGEGPTRVLADCHLHFEGSLPGRVLRALAARARHPFARRASFEARRRKVCDAASFLSLYAEVCSLFRRPEDYAEAAAGVAEACAADGLLYAEVYVSPAIFSRMGLDPAACLEAIDSGFRSRSTHSTCRILLDVVRQWGPESADRVLDLHERKPLPSVVGLGMGGDESAVPAAAFAGVYARARALGLKTSVHAGEWAGADSVREALDALRPDRVDHGLAAASDRALLQRLADEGTTLCVAPSGNVATGAAKSFREHPLPAILRARVRVALCADDPLLFATTTVGEYRVARRRFQLSNSVLRRLAENSWRAAFCPPAEREAALKRLARAPLP